MANGEATVLVSLPDDRRKEFKEPLGPIFTEPSRLVAATSGDVITVGDIVTHHVLGTGHVPSVMVVDRRTKRGPVDHEVLGRLASIDARRLPVSNPAGTLTREALRSLRSAIDDPDPVVIEVDGEEDLLVVPAVLGAPSGTSVVYGQPDVGMVLVRVSRTTTDQVRSLLHRFDGPAEEVETTLTDDVR